MSKVTWGLPSTLAALPSLRSRSVRWIARNRFRCRVVVIMVTILAGSGLYEAHTSTLQSWIFSAIASKLSFQVSSGGSPAGRIVFPSVGPINKTRGYVELPQFVSRLHDAGFHITEQTRLSPELAAFSRLGLTPPYVEPSVVGLAIRDSMGNLIYDARSRQRAFTSYDQIPPLIIAALLLVEDRELAEAQATTRNPVIDWDRSVKAGFLYAAYKLGLPVQIEGGSTLATQLEKFRYADGGRTGSAADKLRQMIGASLQVYRSGPDTTAARRQIVLDYLNSVPLAAAPGYGEVNGVGNGLNAWFGIELDYAASVLQDLTAAPETERVAKHVLALICAARAPTYYLRTNPPALDTRLGYYLHRLEDSGAITAEFAQRIRSAPLRFLPPAPRSGTASYLQRKATTAVRTDIRNVLGVRDLYALDRLNLEIDSTRNSELQNRVLGLFQNMKDPSFIDDHGLGGSQLLAQGNPDQVIYSFTLLERTSIGNVVRVQADTLNQPFNLNEGMKLELGSTAKLRTLAHYLEIVASLHRESHESDNLEEHEAMKISDPITEWAVAALNSHPGITLSAFVELSLRRSYSGSPGEAFFTGGGRHTFSNFDRSEDGAFFTLREGLTHSVNLVYIRLMRDLVRFHEARLSYHREAVLQQPDHADRLRLLEEIADHESVKTLSQAYRDYHGLSSDEIVGRLLGGQQSARRLAMLFLSGHPDSDAAQLKNWMESRGTPVSTGMAGKLLKAYDPARLNIADYGYLLDRHPLEVWCAAQLMDEPDVSLDVMLERSDGPREESSRWLFQTRNKHAQDLRLRIRFEQDAFARMTPYWQRLGFPFDRLVPSLATAIGSSADRPAALAELMGIILNDGVKLPRIQISRMRFAAGTPYETALEPNFQAGQRVMEPEVAQALRDVLANVVQDGTAARLSGAVTDRVGEPVVVGGKTGSGDNRFQSYGDNGRLLSSRVTSRTGTFAFFIGDRYFGVLTAYVQGENANQYRFTSALPVAAVKLLAPSLAEDIGSD
jgi:membrane peptidoglycan carboxypeptidase